MSARLSKKLPVARTQKAAHPTLLTLVVSDDALTFARTIGYARVSREDQNLDMQVAQLQAAGVHQVFEEKLSAVSAKRPQFDLVMKYLEPGDTLIVYAFNRLFRDLKILLGFVDDMKAFGVKLRSLTEPHIDPYTTNGRLLLSVTGAVDENERGRIRDRTRDGMAELKRQGMYLGAPRKITDVKAAKMRIDRKAGMTPAQLARKYKISVGTVNKYAPKGAR